MFMTIYQKLIAAFAVVLLPTVFISSYSIISIEKELRQLGSFHTPALFSIQNIGAGTIEAVEESFAYLVSREIIEKQEFLDWADRLGSVNADFEKVANLHEPGNETARGLFEKIVAGQENMIRFAGFMFSEFELNGKVRVETFHEYEEKIDSLLMIIGGLIEHERIEVEVAQASLLELIDANKKNLAFLFVMSLVLAIVVIYLLSRSISTPLAKLKDMTIEVTKGNLDTGIEVSSNDEIGDLASNFTQMIGQLKRAKQEQENAEQVLLRAEKFASIGQMAATVSHELRNPLGTISMSMRSLRARMDGKGLGLESTLDRIQRNIHRCDTIIEELLEFVRTREPSFEDTMVDQWLAAVLDEMDMPKGISLNRSLHAGVEVSFDRDGLRRALVNTVDNALQAMEFERESGMPDKQRRVSIATRALPDRVEISIRDTGPGITFPDREKIFEPLFSTKTFGVGLGLPIVKRIMKSHGGNVIVHSEPGDGTEVILWLPCSETARISSNGAA